jgi:hypothetical protein|tara:strand:+ start:72 stop:422 length:351 start_codon:yes stop_codon:yes gene_type:complete
MKNKNNFKQSVVNFWQGKISLPISYWLVLTVGSIIVALPAIIITDSYLESFGGLGTLLFILLIIFQYTYTIFAYVGTWRSAIKYKPKKNQWAWGTIAIVFMLLSIIKSIVGIIKSL